jgi:hypothetical protein
VNAALLLLASAWTTGSDVAPPPGAPPAQPPPPVHAPVTAPGCCAGPYVGAFTWGYGCDDCGGRASLHDRLRARFAGRKHHAAADCCDSCATAAPVYAPAPVFHGYPVTGCADPCEDSKHGLLSRFRGRFGGHRNKAADCCDPCWGGAVTIGPWVGYPGGCATPLPAGPAPVVPPPAGGAGEPPKEMPTPKDATPPKTTGPGAQVIQPTPVTPVSGPRLTGTSSPY